MVKHKKEHDLNYKKVNIVTSNGYDKENCKIHCRNLKLYLKPNLKLKEIRKILEFKESTKLNHILVGINVKQK